jgi:hypothetical protein
MSQHECLMTQGREGEKGLWCVDCGDKVYEVETRPCNGCHHYFYSMGGGCRKHLMAVTPDMLVTFKISEGTCWAEPSRKEQE